ncbi:MAG TPA: cupredoxin domain-containing protein [Solirubrobacteraceae bacterium]|nr:cupredoxin domain-containing protein [Solirubrobacteraceae bacterium]
MTRLAMLAPLALAALLAAGCGSSSSNGSSVAAATTSSGGGTRLTLSESEFKIVPAAPTIAQPGVVTITVKNSGAVAHALAVQTPGGLVQTDTIAPGGSATLTVDAAKAGRYTFYCPIPGHRQAGMQGVLIVGGAGASTSAAGSAATTGASSSTQPKYGY